MITAKKECQTIGGTTKLVGVRPREWLLSRIMFELSLKYINTLMY